MTSTKKLLEKFKMRKGYNLISLPSITLTEEEADRFIDYMVDESVMKNFARIERMGKPQKNIRAIGFGSGDFLFPADEFNESKYKKQWVHNKIQLSTIKGRGAFAIFDDDIEDLTGITTEDQFMDQLMKIIAGKVANQLEDIFYMGNIGTTPNTFNADDLKSKLYGWRYQICTGQVGQTYYNNVSGAPYVMNACDGGSSGSDFDLSGKIAEQDTSEPYNWEFKYANMLKNMPSKYKANGGLKQMFFMNSDLVTQDYLIALSARSTVLGDAVFTGAVTPQYGSVPIIDAPLMPTNLGTATYYGAEGAASYTDVMLTLKNNLIVGIQREIKIETQRVPADEATYVYYSIRFALAIENINAIVFMRCLEHAC